MRTTLRALCVLLAVFSCFMLHAQAPGRPGNYSTTQRTPEQQLADLDEIFAQDQIAKLRPIVQELVYKQGNPAHWSMESSRRNNLAANTKNLLHDFPQETKDAAILEYKLQVEGDLVTGRTTRIQYEVIAKILRIPVEELAGIPPGTWDHFGSMLETQRLARLQAEAKQAETEKTQKVLAVLALLAGIVLIPFFTIRATIRRFTFSFQKDRFSIHPIQRIISTILGLGILSIQVYQFVENGIESYGWVVALTAAALFFLVALHGLQTRRRSALDAAPPSHQVAQLAPNLEEPFTASPGSENLGILAEPPVLPLQPLPSEPTFSAQECSEPDQKIVGFTSATNAAGIALLMNACLTLFQQGQSGNPSSQSGPKPYIFEAVLGIFLLIPSQKKRWVWLGVLRAGGGIIVMPVLFAIGFIHIHPFGLVGYLLVCGGTFSMLYKMKGQHSFMPRWRLTTGWALAILGWLLGIVPHAS